MSVQMTATDDLKALRRFHDELRGHIPDKRRLSGGECCELTARVTSLERAIAALPELVEAARAVSNASRADVDAGGYVVGGIQINVLRRILARIDGGKGGRMNRRPLDDCDCEMVRVHHPLDGDCWHKACAIEEEPDCGDIIEGTPTPGRCVTHGNF